MGDFREAYPGSLDKFALELREYAANGNTNSPTSPGGYQATPKKPPKSHPHSQGRTVEWCAPNAAAHGSSRTNTATADTGKRHPGVSSQSLQLCIRSTQFAQVLCEVEMKGSDSDGLLFKSIRETYMKQRRIITSMKYRFTRPTAAIYVKVRPRVSYRTRLALILISSFDSITRTMSVRWLGLSSHRPFLLKSR
jgi:hypothetical protein